MKLKSYLWGIGVGTFFALAGWIFVINNIDPYFSGAVGQTLFYLTAFLSFFGLFSFFLGLIRRRSFAGGNISMGTSLRQGALLSLLVVILLSMQGMRILVWWDGLLAAAGIFLIELYFLSHRD